MREIRRLEQAELIQLKKIHSIAFKQRMDFSKENQEPNPLAHPAEWAVGFFEKGKLMAAMYDLDFLMNFDGHNVKMSGIGGVATLPEARQSGYIRRIFEKLLPEIYEKGAVFSTLTPFSHDFYRKFGYEIACARNNISIAAGDLLEIEPSGQFVHILPGDDLTDLMKVHSAYIAKVNHGIHRDYWPENRSWKHFTSDDPFTTGKFLYLWKDENGIPSSYIKYREEFEDGDYNMSVIELAFIDKKGLFGTLSLAGSLAAQFENFKWAMPTFIDPCDFIGDAWSVEMHLDPKDMTRVVNVKTALELMRRPYCEGKYVIQVKDENISANTGKYLVEFSPKETKVSYTSKEPDVQCDILTLSQLITGYRSLENALYSRKEGLEVYNNIEILKRVFTQRPQHVTEYF